MNTNFTMIMMKAIQTMAMMKIIIMYRDIDGKNGKTLAMYRTTRESEE